MSLHPSLFILNCPEIEVLKKETKRLIILSHSPPSPNQEDFSCKVGRVSFVGASVKDPLSPVSFWKICAARTLATALPDRSPPVVRSTSETGMGLPSKHFPSSFSFPLYTASATPSFDLQTPPPATRIRQFVLLFSPDTGDQLDKEKVVS